MSLQVWLPLNGTLENKGLNQCQFLNGGAVVNNNGKIGQCYDVTNGPIYCRNFSLSTTAFSVFCWVKFTEFSDGNAYIISLNGSGTSGDMQFILGINKSNSNDYAQLAMNVSYIKAGKLYLNKWHHVGFTFLNSAIKTYIDGKPVGSGTITSSAKTHLVIGARSDNSSVTSFKGKISALINDVKIYNHVLSKLEIKENYQTLLLHYKFDDNDNNAPYNYIPLELSHPVSTDNPTELDIKNSTYAGKYWTIPVDNAKQQFTFSAYINNITDQALRLILGYRKSSNDTAVYSFSSGEQIVNPGEQQWCTLTKNYSNIDDIQLNVIMIGIRGPNGVNVSSLSCNPLAAQLQLEVGNARTNFIRGQHNIKPTYVTDSSGYNHNGQTFGNLLTAYDMSARYNKCIYIPFGKTDYVETLDTIGNPNDSLTVNLWFKSASTLGGSGYHSLAAVVDSEPRKIELAVKCADGYFRSGLRIDGTRYATNYAPNILDDKWHMVTIAYDGANIKRYVDAVQKSNDSVLGTLEAQNNKFRIGRFGNNNENFYTVDGYLSDFRVYATALDDNDIKNLYNIGMKMDNLKNIHVFEYKEKNNNIKLFKTGTFQEKEIYADNETIKFGKTGDIYASDFIER